MQGLPLECIAYLSECDPTKRYEVKEVKRRRTLTQNAYYWQLLNQLARKLHMPDHEVHHNMLRDYGICEVMSVSKAVPLDDYFRHYDVLGADGHMRIVKVYKGSSQMDSSEFAHLVEGMRAECEEQGIDVMTPEEISRLRFVEPER